MTIYNKIVKILFRKFSPSHWFDVVVFKCREILPTGNRRNRELITRHKNHSDDTFFRLQLASSGPSQFGPIYLQLGTFLQLRRHISSHPLSRSRELGRYYYLFPSASSIQTSCTEANNHFRTFQSVMIRSLAAVQPPSSRVESTVKITDVEGNPPLPTRRRRWKLNSTESEHCSRRLQRRLPTPRHGVFVPY